jgi:hypothetical protein
MRPFSPSPGWRKNISVALDLSPIAFQSLLVANPLR